MGGAGGAAGLDLIAQLLDERPGVLTARELLDCSPNEGTLLLVAREYSRLGEHRKALRAARRAAQALGPTASVTSVWGEVRDRSGRGEEAEQLRDAALHGLLAPPT